MWRMEVKKATVDDAAVRPETEAMSAGECRAVGCTIASGRSSWATANAASICMSVCKQMPSCCLSAS